MKKFISLLLITFFSSVAHANYTPGNNIIKVVIPQPPASGLGSIYRHMEAYASKQNIKMIPVFKPGANAKIGISYANEKNNDGNTLLFSTVSDYVNVNLDFDAVAPITKIDMILVASKKSKIKTVDDIVKQEQANPGKLTWAYMSSVQSVYIDNFLKVSNIDVNKVYKVPFGAKIFPSVINGDVDLAMVSPSSIGALGDRLTVLEIDKETSQKLALKENATGLFLPKNSHKDSIKFWNKFINDFLNDEDVKASMKTSNVRTFTNTQSNELTTIVNNWKL